MLRILKKSQIFCFFIIFALSSCAYKKQLSNTISSVGLSSLAIEMPENKLVFENLSSIVYDSLWSHFDRVGYRLVSRDFADYSLVISIKSIDSGYRFLSPDLLTYAEKIRIELFCRLYDTRDNSPDKIIKSKLFVFTHLVSKSKDYVENSAFLDFEYRRLLEKKAYRIDRYFRDYLIKKDANKKRLL